MAERTASGEAADYGLDAPEVVRNLLIAAGIGVALWLTTVIRLWSGVVRIGPLVFPLGSIGLILAVVCGGLAVWMAWDSHIGKIKGRDRLLDLLTWTGAERVLDVGCGRGLMLIGAAKRLASGKATGIDIWQAEDLSGNRPEATLENARIEGVAERVEVSTADMRTMPFPDATFDVVVSSNAIHNLYEAPDRAKAVAEIARVLKPGGEALIVDIRHYSQYAHVLAQHGCTEIRRRSSVLPAAALCLLTMGSLRPAVLTARKMRESAGAADA